MLCRATNLLVMVLNQKYLMKSILTFWKKCLVMLFTRVRTFSYAKDISEKYKSKKKVKKSSLSTEIKKASSSTDRSLNYAVPDMDSKNCQNGYLYSHK